MESLALFRQIAETPMRQWSTRFQGHRPVGVYNAYFPQELLHAAGLTPVYLFHQPTDFGNTRTHLPSFTCWPGKSLVDQALSGELSGLHGMAFAKTCDTVQALTDIWREAMPKVPVYHFGMPTNLTSSSARSYLIAELQHLRHILGNPSDESLSESASVYNKTRMLVDGLYQRAHLVKPSDLYAVLKASHMMPKPSFNRLLRQLLAELPEEVEFHGPRLILVGPHLSDKSLFRAIEEAGARITDDVLDVGRRYYEPSVADAKAALPGLADRLLSAVPTPTKYNPLRRRDQLLIERVDRSRADGVIFSRQAFCDPHGFDYARCVSALNARKIPSLYLELEQASQIGQIHTRVEAFLETIAR